MKRGAHPLFLRGVAGTVSAILAVSLLLFISLLMSGAMLLAWGQFSREPHLLLWAAAYAASAAQWVTNMAGLALGNPLLLYICGICLVASVALIYAGILRRRDPAASLRPTAICALLVAAIAGVMTLTMGTGLALSVFLPLYGAVVMAACAWRLLPFRHSVRAVETAYAVMLLLFAIFEVVLAFTGFQAATIDSEEWKQAYRIVLIGGLPPIFIGTGIAAILMVAGDLAARLRIQSLSDPLTGLFNRRGFEEFGLRAFAAARKRSGNLAAIVCDLDGFKRFNDAHGHAAGDAALQRFAEVLQQVLPHRKVVARLGGDEFVILLPGARSEQAANTADRLGTALTGVRFADAPEEQLRSSFGVTELAPDDQALEQLVARADAALYRAKSSGRNQVAVA